MARPNFLRKKIVVYSKKELDDLIKQLEEDKKMAGQIKVVAELNWAEENKDAVEYNQVHNNYMEMFRAVNVPLTLNWYDNTPWEKQVHTDDIDFMLNDNLNMQHLLHISEEDAGIAASFSSTKSSTLDSLIAIAGPGNIGVGNKEVKNKEVDAR